MFSLVPRRSHREVGHSAVKCVRSWAIILTGSVLSSRIANPPWLKNHHLASHTLGGTGLSKQKPMNGAQHLIHTAHWRRQLWSRSSRLGKYSFIPLGNLKNMASSLSQNAPREHTAMAVARFVTVWTTPPVTTSLAPATAAQDGKEHAVIKVKL